MPLPEGKSVFNKYPVSQATVNKVYRPAMVKTLGEALEDARKEEKELSPMERRVKKRTERSGRQWGRGKTVGYISLPVEEIEKMRGERDEEAENNE